MLGGACLCTREAREKAPPGAVVATDSASANADCDNGAPLQRAPRRGRDDGAAGYRVLGVGGAMPIRTSRVVGHEEHTSYTSLQTMVHSRLPRTTCRHKLSVSSVGRVELVGERGRRFCGCFRAGRDLLGGCRVPAHQSHTPRRCIDSL